MPSSTDKSTLCPALSIATITCTSSSGSPPLLPLYQSFTLIKFDPQLSLQTADVLGTLINQRYHSRAAWLWYFWGTKKKGNEIGLHYQRFPEMYLFYVECHEFADLSFPVLFSGSKAQRRLPQCLKMSCNWFITPRPTPPRWDPPHCVEHLSPFQAQELIVSCCLFWVQN